ncbi:hypothetical protein [Thermogutta sp.]|uniref:hypothetical protein n=1 Tax=Thermogutta sp. TaxID=1962930 RepID=UPI00321F80D3
MRAFGWIAAAILFTWSVWTLWPRSTTVELPEELIHQTVESIRQTPDSHWPEDLAKLEDRLPTPTVQVILAQGIPGEPALVLAVPTDSSEEEQSTHWRLPWPKLSGVLAKGAAQPVAVSESRHRVRYIHHVFPVDGEKQRYLVVTRLDPSTGPRWWAWISLFTAVAIGIALFFIPEN